MRAWLKLSMTLHSNSNPLAGLSYKIILLLSLFCSATLRTGLSYQMFGHLFEKIPLLVQRFDKKLLRSGRVRVKIKTTRRFGFICRCLGDVPI